MSRITQISLLFLGCVVFSCVAIEIPDDVNFIQNEVVVDQLVTDSKADPVQPAVSIRAALNEFIAMTLFVIIGCGSAMGVCNQPGWVLQVALTFGFAITSLAAATGGQINCAVTLSFVILGKLTYLQAGANFLAQMVGSLFGAYILRIMYPPTADLTGNLGSNKINDGFDLMQALLGETVMTFLLVFVVCNTPTQVTAAISVGFAVFLAHSVLIPIDGCSINPTRSFGPAVIATCTGKEDYFQKKDMMVFWVGPLLGAALAAAFIRFTAA